MLRETICIFFIFVVLKKGLVVQWIEFQIPVLTMRVRISPSSHILNEKDEKNETNEKILF